MYKEVLKEEITDVIFSDKEQTVQFDMAIHIKGDTFSDTLQIKGKDYSFVAGRKTDILSFSEIVKIDNRITYQLFKLAYYSNCSKKLDKLRKKLIRITIEKDIVLDNSSLKSNYSYKDANVFGVSSWLKDPKNHRYSFDFQQVKIERYYIQNMVQVYLESQLHKHTAYCQNLSEEPSLYFKMEKILVGNCNDKNNPVCKYSGITIKYNFQEKKYELPEGNYNNYGRDSSYNIFGYVLNDQKLNQENFVEETFEKLYEEAIEKKVELNFHLPEHGLFKF